MCIRDRHICSSCIICLNGHYLKSYGQFGAGSHRNFLLWRGWKHLIYVFKLKFEYDFLSVYGTNFQKFRFNDLVRFIRLHLSYQPSILTNYWAQYEFFWEQFFQWFLNRCVRSQIHSFTKWIVKGTFQFLHA